MTKSSPVPNPLSKADILKLRDFARRVGEFIRYWGFRNIHGEIWTCLYLAHVPLSGVELTELLDVSKALVSPALKELEAEGLIFEVKGENAKVKLYRPIDDVCEVIRRVLQNRETPMLEKIQDAFVKLEAGSGAELGNFLDAERVARVGDMIQTAQLGISFLTATEDLWE